MALGEGTSLLCGDLEVPPGAWTHACAVNDGANTSTLYINGDECGTVDGFLATPPLPPITIGAYQHQPHQRGSRGSGNSSAQLQAQPDSIPCLAMRFPPTASVSLPPLPFLFPSLPFPSALARAGFLNGSSADGRLGFLGVLDDVLLFAAALQPGEVAYLYRAPGSPLMLATFGDWAGFGGRGGATLSPTVAGSLFPRFTALPPAAVDTVAGQFAGPADRVARFANGALVSRESSGMSCYSARFSASAQPHGASSLCLCRSRPRTSYLYSTPPMARSSLYRPSYSFCSSNGKPSASRHSQPHLLRMVPHRAGLPRPLPAVRVPAPLHARLAGRALLAAAHQRQPPADGGRPGPGRLPGGGRVRTCRGSPAADAVILAPHLRHPGGRQRLPLPGRGAAADADGRGGGAGAGVGVASHR